ncbi:MAG: alpha/beta hydrolase [Chloroflexota bacterium]|nr:alpha/beta hydrolase [Chloroflexota bacterium]
MTSRGDRLGSGGEPLPDGAVVEPRPPRPVRKDEIVIASRGLYVESWLPERRSRRKPLFLLHGELSGSWIWERYLSYFAQRGWEGHALNLQAHFWSETADLASLDLDSYLADAQAGLDALGRPAVLVGHGLGALLTLKLAEVQEVLALVLIAPALPQPIRPEPPPHVVRLVPAIFRQELIGWAGALEPIRQQNPDLSAADVRRIQHLMGAESGAARRQMLSGVPVERESLRGIPALILGGGRDRLFPAAEAERLAEWLGADYQPFPDHSHFGLVVGERTHEPVADAIRTFLEVHRL